MAASTSNIIPTVNTTAASRAYVALFETVLTAGGWIQTADTGQTASGSFIAGTTLLTSNGYQVWRMNDALQGSFPVFVKLEWGTGVATNSFGMWITIGTGSNGSGTITGILGARMALSANTVYASSVPSYVSATSSRLTAYCSYDTGALVGVFFDLERSKDSTGADTSSGVIFQSMSGNSLIQAQYLPFSGVTRAVQATFSAPVVLSLGSLADGGGNIGMVPLLPQSPTGPVNPGFGALAYFGTDLTVAQMISVTVRGGSHTYFTAGTGGFAANIFGFNGSNLAFLYE